MPAADLTVSDGSAAPPVPGRRVHWLEFFFDLVMVAEAVVAASAIVIAVMLGLNEINFRRVQARLAHDAA